MDDRLRKIAEKFLEFQEFGGATDDEGVLSPEEIKKLLDSDEEGEW